MFFFLSVIASCSQYAILYAGSKDFVNYRHQADIFTIYHQLIARGFQTTQIALYAYDDIATDPSNPFSGQVFHTVDHKVNVYPGSAAINVKGSQVDADAFYKAIAAVPTTSEDYVLIYYDNHGGPGLLGTPTGMFIYPMLMDNEFYTLSSKKRYKQLLFIIEACFSGSVGKYFSYPNFAIITAANADESSYAAVYDSEVGTYLSNEFTNYFLDLIDENPEISVGDLFTTLQEETQKSHVCYFGDQSLKTTPISAFIGKPKETTARNRNKNSLQLDKPKDVTEKTLKLLSQHPKASIRARARLQQLKLKSQTEKLEIVLELLVKYVDPKNYDYIMNDTKAELTQTYFDVLPVFFERFGEINQDDLGRLNVLKALAASHTKTEIVQGIFAVVF